MICNKCKNVGFYNEVMGKGFYYCRTCKDEIVLQSVQSYVNSGFRVGDKVFVKADPFIDGIVEATSDKGLVLVKSDNNGICYYNVDELELVPVLDLKDLDVFFSVTP